MIKGLALIGVFLCVFSGVRVLANGCLVPPSLQAGYYYGGMNPCGNMGYNPNNYYYGSTFPNYGFQPGYNGFNPTAYIPYGGNAGYGGYGGGYTNPIGYGNGYGYPAGGMNNGQRFLAQTWACGGAAGHQTTNPAGYESHFIPPGQCRRFNLIAVMNPARGMEDVVYVPAGY